MKHPQRVDDYLEHIAEAIERATSYLQPLRDVEALGQNSQVQDAIVRNIEIIGEAAAHIYNREPDFIQQHPQLPWAQMRAMRNAVIHDLERWALLRSAPTYKRRSRHTMTPPVGWR